MRLDRRGVLGLGVIAAAGPALAMPMAPLPRRLEIGDVSPGFRGAVAAIADHAAADLIANGFPGMAIAVRSASGETARLAIGHAWLAPPQPLGAVALFQIGSISKSLVAMTLFTLAGQGKLDLDASALSVVPELPLAEPSVTIAQLLSHSAGLPDNAPPFAAVPGGRLWSATPPGQHFSYSNAGYDMLAFVVERVSGLRYDRALKALVLAPLGMASAEPVIRSEDRGRYAQGYVPFAADRAWFAGGQLAEGPWLDIDRAAGSVAMTSADMLAYLAFAARLARGDGAPLFGPALAKRFVTPTIGTDEFGPGGHYGNGLATIDLAGSPLLFHTGGMLLFSSAVGIDRASGAGVFASVNVAGSSYRPRAVVKHGVALLRAVAAGQPLPPAPAFDAGLKVDHGGDFAGTFIGPAGDRLVVTVAGDGLALDGGGRLKPLGSSSFVAELPPRARHALEFAGTSGRRDRLWWGATLYGRDAPVAQPAAPAALAALAGVYTANDPWIGGTEIIARGETLVVEGAGEIRAAPDGSWRFADPAQVTDRLWFEHPVAGRPERLNLSGQLMDRLRT